LGEQYNRILPMKYLVLLPFLTSALFAEITDGVHSSISTYVEYSCNE
jgi:hypothetical protein